MRIFLSVRDVTIAATLLVCLITESTTVAAPALAAQGELKVLTYNIWGLPSRLLKKKQRIAAIARVAPLLSADVIGFQEAFHGLTDRLAHMKGYPYIARGADSDPLRFNSGLLLVSKWPIVATQRLSYSMCAGIDCFAQKGALFTRVRFPWGEVDFYLTHMNAAGDESVRSYQLSQFLQFVQAQSPEGYDRRPVVLMGDFNFEPTSANYARLVRMTQSRDSHLEFVSRSPNTSSVVRDGFTSDPRRNSNTSQKNKAKRIDFVLYRSSKKLDLSVMSSSLAFDAPVDGMYLSDHFGVSVRYQVRR